MDYVALIIDNTQYIVIALVVLFALIIFKSGYLKASPDEAFIISGLKKRTLIGRAGLRIPFFERKDTVHLNLISIDVKTSNAVPTADYININVDATVNVKVGSSETLIDLAAQNFLNKNTEYIAHVAREVLEGNVREIVGKMALEEMVSDRQKFASLVKENAEPDLAAMGLEIISFNVQNFTDGNGVIENLGVDNVVRIQKNAAISRADSEKEIAKAQASAKSEANEAEIKAETEIAERTNELDIKKAQLKVEADKERAVADAAYNIAAEEQRRSVEIARADANIAQQEKERELQERMAEVAEQQLNATVRKQADAEKYRREREAEASLIEQQKDAEADLAKAERGAEAEKMRAEASKYAKEMEAQGIAALGEAEASAIKAKGEAEAAAMEKRAEAYEKYGNAAMMEMIVQILPQMASEIAKSVTTIDKVTIIDSGNGESGVGMVSSWTPAMMAKTIDAVREATGLDIMEVMRAGTYDAKVNRNITIDGIGGCPGHDCHGNCYNGSKPAINVTEDEASGDSDEHAYDQDGIEQHG